MHFGGTFHFQRFTKLSIFKYSFRHCEKIINKNKWNHEAIIVPDSLEH